LLINASFNRVGAASKRRRALFLFTQTFFCVVFFYELNTRSAPFWLAAWFDILDGRVRNGEKMTEKTLPPKSFFFLLFTPRMLIFSFFLLVCICEPTLSFSHLGAIVSCSNTHNTFYLKSSPSLSSAWNSSLFLIFKDDSVGEKMLVHADALFKKFYVLFCRNESSDDVNTAVA